jgi:perosamine synthetase
MFRLVPPAGTPTSLVELTHMIVRRLELGTGTDQLEKKFAALMGIRHCFSFSSGRTALTCLLKVVARRAKSGRDEVVIPAYTCFSVPAAIIRAGLKIRLVDVNLHDLDYDYEQFKNLDLSRVLAVIGCNLFGIPSDVERMRHMLGSEPICLIDDAAQAMGVHHDKYLCGCRGNAGIFSFGRGKNLSTYSGGLLVTNDDNLALEIDLAASDLPDQSLAMETFLIAKIALASLLLRPNLFWIPDRMPFLHLGETLFDPDFSMGRLTSLQNCLGAVLVDRLTELNERRAAIAGQIAEAAIVASAFEVPGYQRGATRCYLRVPLLARNRTHRDVAIAVIKKAGIKAAVMYPSTVNKISGIDKYVRNDIKIFPAAEQVVERLVALPTHGYVGPNDVERIIKCLNSLR